MLTLTYKARLAKKAGPPSMTDTIRQVLATVPVDQDDIISEDFVGY